MRIRLCAQKDWKVLRTAFPELPASRTPKSIVLWCEEEGSPWAFAWAEPLEDKPDDWRLRAVGAIPVKKRLGLESQVLITLEIEIEKRKGKSLSAWTDADLDAETPNAERDLFKARGYRFREYQADFFGAGAPGDRWTRQLHPEEYCGMSDPEKVGGSDGMFPMLSLN